LRELRPDLVVFHHDVFRDWAIGCLLSEEPARIAELPLTIPAPEALIRGVEIAARLAVERSADDAQWSALLARLSGNEIHGSWRRAVLLALVRSELGVPILDRASAFLAANAGALLKELIRVTIAVESKSAATAYAASGFDLSVIPPDFIVPATPSWGRLIFWSHLRIDDLPNTVIPDLSDFYSKWSMALFGQDDLTPYLLAHLHTWLLEMEAALHPDHFSQLRRPFGMPMSSERELDLEENLRLTFLAFCRRVPELAEQYLRSTAARKPGHHIAWEIMKYRGSSAQAAPEALADLTLRTLIPEHDDGESSPSGYDLHGPFDANDSIFSPPSPAQGPMLELLVHSPQDGLRVVRELVDVAIKYYGGGHEVGDDVIVIPLSGGDRSFPWIRSYNWSRSGGVNSSIVTSALMALEAWAHMRIEAGDTVDAVLAYVIGPTDSPAAFLLVAVDIPISHFPKTAAAAIPFLACPILLSLDRERHAHDFRPTDNWGHEPQGLSSLKSLKERPSRRAGLDELIGRYACWGLDMLPHLQQELSIAAAREGPPEPGRATMRDVRFAAAHAVNLAEPSNWSEECPRQDDGTVHGFRYQPPATEEALAAPDQSRRNAKTLDLMLRMTLPLALTDRAKSSPDLIAKAVAWAQKADPDPEDKQSEETDGRDWRRQARVTAAALAIRDGGEDFCAKNEAWARQVLVEALGAPDDPVNSHPMLPFNTVAIAAVGMISLVRRKPDAAGLYSLLLAAARADDAMLPAFSAELSALNDIDKRLPRSLMRIAFSSSVQTLYNYDESEESRAARVEAHRQRVRNDIEQEIAWLEGASDEPVWPPFPADPSPRRRKYVSIGRRNWQEQQTEERVRPLDVVDSRSAATWIQNAVPLLGQNSMQWFRALLDSYAQWTAIANGEGFDDDEEPDRAPREWNMAYFDLAARVMSGLPPEEADGLVLQRILGFPDEAFFDVTAILVRSLDDLHFDQSVIDGAEALRLRARLVQRLVQTRSWRRATDRRSSSIEMHLGRAISSLFCHNESWGGGNCYLYPNGAERLNAFLSLLADLAVEAAASEYIALQFQDLLELHVQTENLGHAVRTATAWLEKYPDDTTFWIEHGMGRRVCAWLAEAVRADAGAFLTAAAAMTAEIDRLLDALLSLGVSAAKPLEEAVERIRKNQWSG
jgi:PAS domain-containing protein